MHRGPGQAEAVPADGWCHAAGALLLVGAVGMMLAVCACTSVAASR